MAKAPDTRSFSFNLVIVFFIKDFLYSETHSWVHQL